MQNIIMLAKIMYEWWPASNSCSPRQNCNLYVPCVFGVHVKAVSIYSAKGISAEADS